MRLYFLLFMYVRVCVSTSVCINIHVLVCICLPGWLSGCLSACLYMCVHTYAHTLHTYHTHTGNLHACMHIFTKSFMLRHLSQLSPSSSLLFRCCGAQERQRVPLRGWVQRGRCDGVCWTVSVHPKGFMVSGRGLNFELVGCMVCSMQHLESGKATFITALQIDCKR